MAKKVSFFATLVIAAMIKSALADPPVVTLSTSNLLPNTPNQTIQLLIQGTDLISGEDLNFQINGAGSGPTMTAINLLSGTIFANNHQSPTGPGIVNSGTVSGRLAISSLTTSNSTVPDVGLLASLTISTDANSGGSFIFRLLNTLNGSSDLIIPNPSNTNSALTIALQFPHNQLSIGTPNRQWTVNGGGTWASDSHWTPFAPYAQGDIANFLGAATSGTATITLDGDQTAGVLNFNNANASYVVAQGTGGTLLLNNGATQSSIITTLAGQHSITAPVQLMTNSNISVSSGSTLTISGNVSGPSSSISLMGAGKLILTGVNNSYGSTSIALGATLQVGSGATGSLGSSGLANSGLLNINRTGTITINGPISGAGTLTHTGAGTTTLLGAYSATGPINVNAGKLVMPGGSTAALTNSLSIAGTPTAPTATLDLKNGGIALSYTSGGAVLTAAVTARTVAARGSVVGGTYNYSGAGITSSSAAANNLFAGFDRYAVGVVNNRDLLDLSTPFDSVHKFMNQPVGPNTVLARYTYNGDATLDGVINLDDYNLIDAAFSGVLSGYSGWVTGDFNGDGVINLDDFNIIDFGFQFQGAPLSDGGIVPLVVLSTSPSATSPVPEPTSLGLFILAIAVLSPHRRAKAFPSFT